MPDSRLAQFVIPASIIDETPFIVVGAMAGMIVMQANPDGGSMGVHYIAWHANFPTMPLHALKPGEKSTEFIPWITVTVNEGPKDADADSGRLRLRYIWETLEGKFKKIVLHGEFTLVQPLEEEIEVVRPAANQNGEASQ